MTFVRSISFLVSSKNIVTKQTGESNDKIIIYLLAMLNIHRAAFPQGMTLCHILGLNDPRSYTT